MPASPEKTAYIPTLDGWRAMAILGVMIYHGTTSWFYPYGPCPSYESLLVIQQGAKGVDIFFALSGFLICSRLLEERRKTGGINLKRFYFRRGFRILPPYYFYLAVLAAVTATGLIVVQPMEWWGCLLFFRNYLPPLQTHGWYTGHFWSLSV